MSFLTSPQRRILIESDFERRKRARQARHEQGDLEAQTRVDTETGRYQPQTFSIYRSPGGEFRLVPTGQLTEIGSIPIVSGIPITDRQLANRFLPRLSRARPEASTFQQDVDAGRSKPIWIHRAGCPACGRPIFPSVVRLENEKCPLSKALGVSYLAHFTAKGNGWELDNWRRFPWGQALWDLAQELVSNPIDWQTLRSLVLKNSN